jgi:hypothetical protein
MIAMLRTAPLMKAAATAEATRVRMVVIGIPLLLCSTAPGLSRGADGASQHFVQVRRSQQGLQEMQWRRARVARERIANEKAPRIAPERLLYRRR